MLATYYDTDGSVGSSAQSLTHHFLVSRLSKLSLTTSRYSQNVYAGTNIEYLL